MSSAISSGTTGPVVLSTASNPLSITGTGAVPSTGSGVNGFNGGTGTTWSIAGTISSSGGDGVSLASELSSGAGVYITGGAGTATNNSAARQSGPRAAPCSKRASE
jgi:hypothetical protein